MLDDILNDDWSMVDDSFEELDVSILGDTHPFELMCQHKDYQPDQRHMLFVYGSMKRGYPNHHRLTARPNNKFLGKVETMSSMFVMGTRTSERGLLVPVVYKLGLNNYNIYGELYEIDGPTLFNIDLAEGNPDIYKRENVTVFLSGTLHGAHIYLYTKKFDGEQNDPYVLTYAKGAEYKGTQRFWCKEYERK